MALNLFIRWGRFILIILFLILETTLRQVVSLIFKFIPTGYVTSGLSWTADKLQLTASVEDPDMEKDAADLIRSKGYPVEEHTAITSDGFLLGLQRIPHGRNNDQRGNEPRPVVFLQHGFLQCSETFVIRKQPEQNLALVLADSGYDVWLGNNRGNKYSHKHKTFKPTEERFWDWSLDELMSEDVPAMLGHVLKVTQVPKLTYIGFSQGSAQAFGAFSRFPELADRVNLFVALAPASKVLPLQNPLVDVLARTRPDVLFHMFGKKAFIPITLFWRKKLDRDFFVKTIDICTSFLFNWHSKMIDPVEKPLIYSHIYSYGSVKSVVHWFQIMRSRKFQMYDDYQECNTGDEYSGQVPPVYHTNQIKCPVALFYGASDTLPNIKAIIKDLNPDKLVHVEEVPEYEHLDFMWAKDVHKKVYPRLLDVLKHPENSAVASQ
jgi:lysosomal acid lipase/cholesteryl ester hydrolase